MAVLEVNVVGALAELLRDRYRRGLGELPILKEIIQNADDARATELHLIVLDEGLQDAENPLLHGQALVCVNDGPFTEEHENALRYFGLTSKAGDHSAVGRFGLGQKSIFHLAEAYFYLGRSSPDSPVLADVIDPWEGPKGDRDKPEWTVFSAADRTRVQRALAAWLGGPAFFVLYIPLRRENHRRGSGSVISPHFPVISELRRDLEDLAELGALLPQLHSVGRIESWTLSGASGTRTSLGRTAWTAKEATLSRPSDARSFARAFGGAIEVATSAGTRTVHASGFERCVQDAELSRLPQDRGWPRRVVDPVTGEDIPEKAVPHGAVTVQCATEGPPGLRLSWAVFLPLGTRDQILDAPGVRSNWCIWLHAYGFPDSGRRVFAGVDEPTNGPRDHFIELRARWNVRLVEVATFACLLDALAPALEAVDADEGENMVRALVASGFWSRHAAAVKGAFRLAWGPGVRSNAPAPESRPLRIPTERRVLRIQRPRPDEFAEVGDILRAWLRIEVATDATVIWADSPIVNPDPRCDVWRAPELERALASIEARVLKSAAALTYVADALEDVARSSPDVGTAVRGFLRRCFREAVLTPFGEQGTEWTRLAALCPPRTILWSSAGVTLLRELSREPTSILLLSSTLRPSAESASPDISYDDARALLRILSAKVRGAQAVADAQGIVAEIVAAVGPTVVRQDPELGALPLFRVWSARESRHICVQPAELAALSTRGFAFRKRGIAAPEQLARKLSACVAGAEADVLVVDDDAVADAMSVSPFELDDLARAVLHPLSRAGTLEQRLDLFNHVAFGPFAIRDAEARVRASTEVRRALRVLIHGSRERAADDTPLFLAVAGLEEPFAEIARVVLEAMGDGWRVVGEAFGHHLSRGWQAALGIRPLTEDILVTAMSEKDGPWRLEIGPVLGGDLCTALARLLATKGAYALFASLAIHRTQDGAIVRGGQPDIWLEGSWPVPPSLAPNVSLISLSDNPAVRDAQQRSLRPSWSPDEQIAVCLANDPARRTREILDAIDAIEFCELSRELRATLRKARWLPTKDGPVPPGDVLDVPPDVDRAFRGLLGDAELVFRAPGMIDAETRQHRAFPKVLDGLALRDEEAVHAMAQQLDVHVEDGANRFWVLAARARDQEREFLARAIAVPCLRSDPTWAFLASLDHWSPGKWADGDGGRELLGVLRREPSAKRVTELLVRFRDETNLAPADVELSRAVFEDHLRYAGARPDFVAAVLPKVYLLNANKTWRPTTAIAAFDANLQDQFRLFGRHRQILDVREQVAADMATALGQSKKRTRPSEADMKRAGETLGNYFAAWTGRVSPEAIGYFLACLGDGSDNSVAARAHGYLHPSITVDGAREKLLYEYSAIQISTEFGSLRDASWAVDVVDEGEVREVPSLAGTRLEARVAGSGLGGIFVGDIPGTSSRGGQWLRLRRVDPAAHEPRELHQALGASVHAFLQSALSVPVGPAFDVFWAELGRGGQTQIEAVRGLVLEHLPVHLEALQLRQDERFRVLLLEVDRAEQRYRERSGNNRLWQDARSQAEQKRRDSHATLRRTVEEDEDAQRRMVRAVRVKLRHYQYSLEQVLFELFQNADDAASEIVELRSGSASAADERARQIHIAVDRVAPTLRVEHWGRPINRAGINAAGSSSPERAFELDLKNMLVLNLSDKDAAATGRFGLGFKSVHLLTHRPRVRSGDLSFEIVGGILPRFVPYDRAPEISTRIELPLDEVALADRALGRIVSHGSLLPVFARTIRRLVVEDGERRESSWEPTLVGGREELEVGTVPAALGGSRSESTRLFVVRGTAESRRFAIAFRLGVAGVDAFAATQPDIWCTAPTLERWGMGYCMNAPFVLDVGRGQLARDSADNERLFRRLGELLVNGLRELAQLFADDFQRVVAELGLETGSREPEAVCQRFWHSMFERLTQLPGEEASDRTALVRAMQGEAGLGAVVSEHRVLPTWLPGRHDVLTTTRVVEWVFDEVVAQPEVFRTLAGLGWLAKSVVPGTAIHVDVARRLARIGAQPLRATEVKLAGVLERSLPPRSVITPEMARSLWHVWRALESATHLPGRPDEVLRGQLGAARFTTAAEKPNEPSAILVGRSLETLVAGLDRKRYHDLGDELLRSDFAPPQHVLHAKYADQAMLELFLFARQRLQRGGAAELARWATEATDGPRQRAALTYLASGEQAEGMSAALEELGGLSWCRRTSELEALMTGSPLSEAALGHLRIRCGFQRSLAPNLGDVFDDEDERVDVPNEVRVRDPGVVLMRISRWWATRGKVWSERHDKRVYVGLKAGVNGLRNDLLASRSEAWTLLFTIAACQRFGRQSDDQHAGFLRRLQEQGDPKWWSIVTADPRKVKPDAWMRVIDQWLDTRVDSDPYRLWLGLFPTLYQLHRHGSTYRQLLVRADHQMLARAFSVDAHLAPRANPALTGAGAAFDAPPLAPALGIGACWILRELVRLGVVTRKPHVVPYCYVPRAPTRRLMQLLGASDLEEPGVTHGERSRRIYGFLARVLGEDATFGGAFDLPLYLYETDLEARHEAEVS